MCLHLVIRQYFCTSAVLTTLITISISYSQLLWMQVSPGLLVLFIFFVCFCLFVCDLVQCSLVGTDVHCRVFENMFWLISLSMEFTSHSFALVLYLEPYTLRCRLSSEQLFEAVQNTHNTNAVQLE